MRNKCFYICAALKNVSINLAIANLSLKLMLYKEERGECYNLKFIAEETIEFQGGGEWEECGL